MDSFTFELSREEVLDLYLVLVDQDGRGGTTDRSEEFLQRLTQQCRTILSLPGRKDGHAQGKG